MISFLLDTDTSVHGEVPDFYEGKTNSNTELSWFE